MHKKDISSVLSKTSEEGASHRNYMKKISENSTSNIKIETEKRLTLKEYSTTWNPTTLKMLMFSRQTREYTHLVDVNKLKAVEKIMVSVFVKSGK